MDQGSYQISYSRYYISNIVKLLALALTNLVLDLAKTNLTKPGLDLDKTWAKTRHYI